jgi:hypothetical protein
MPERDAVIARSGATKLALGMMAVGWAKALFAPCPPSSSESGGGDEMVGTPLGAHSRVSLALPTLRATADINQMA